MELMLGVLTLGAAQWLIGALSVLFLLSSVVLILTVLIQRPQGGGLSGAFGGGGGGSGETAFGARTGDALTIATIAFFVIWLVIAVGLVLVMRPDRAISGGPAAVSTNPADVVPESGAGTGAAPDAGQTPADQPPPEQPATDGDTPTTEGPGADDSTGPADGGGESDDAGETGGDTTGGG